MQGSIFEMLTAGKSALSPYSGRQSYVSAVPATSHSMWARWGTSTVQPVVSAENCCRIVERNRKPQRCVTEVRIPEGLHEKLAQICPHGIGECEAALARQQLDEAEHIGPLLSYVPGIDGFAICPALGKVKKRAFLERDEGSYPW